MSILGNRVRRVEDPRFLTVGGTYTSDLRDPLLDGALHVTFVRSTVAPYKPLRDQHLLPGIPYPQQSNAVNLASVFSARPGGDGAGPPSRDRNGRGSRPAPTTRYYSQLAGPRCEIFVGVGSTPMTARTVGRPVA